MEPVPQAALAVALLIVPLSGCLSLGEGAACSVSVPRPRAGLVADYAAQGEIDVPWSHPVGIVEATSRRALEFSEGSKLRVATDAETTDVLDLYARLQPAFQVTYWADLPERNAPIPYADQWIDAETGVMVHGSTRTQEVGGEEAFHGRQFAYLNRPPLLFATLLAGRHLDNGQAGEVSYTDSYGGFLDAGPTPAPNHTLRWRVQETRETPAGCKAEVTVGPGRPCPTVNGTEAPCETIRLTFSSDRPLPVRYRLEPHPKLRAEGNPGVTLELEAFSPGQGTELPRFQGETWFQPTALDRKPLQDGFLADRGGFFATDFDRAMEAARDRPATRAWMDDHPDARLARVEHRQGRPNSTVIDQWLLCWRAPDDEDHGVVVRNRSLTPLRVTSQREASGTGCAIDEATYPEDRPDRAVTLASVVELHRRMRGETPAALKCTISIQACFFGTHESTQMPYAGESGVHVPGWVVFFDRGWIPVEQSFDETDLRPPAGPPP